MLKTMLALFAKPLGAAINNALSAGAGATVLWATSKGVDANLTTTVVGSLVFALSNIISGLAATQGVQIPVINNDVTNGVKVVRSSVTAATVDGPNPSTFGG